ncbi:hypothetical protein CRG98_031234 [Punica granatum]|uniref:Aminotransferase-like plant mobile domain-containing protein n=1 Tax=Punica granatum TaxID=22663 RepID=A0A2I0IWI0_PUNGR|nr:hypothetical protein CRG98_031234 [Punica granatum]
MNVFVHHGPISQDARTVDRSPDTRICSSFGFLGNGDSFSCASVTCSPKKVDILSPAIVRTHAGLDETKLVSEQFGDSTGDVDWSFLEAASTSWDPVNVNFNIKGTKLTPTIEEYRTLICRTVITLGIVEPNFRTTRSTIVSRLLGVHRSQLHAKLTYSNSIEIVTAKLIHAFLLLIFGTLLFPCTTDLIDAALASINLHVVGGCAYEVALVAETIRFLDRITRTSEQRLRGSPILLQIWLQSNADPLSLMPPRPMNLRCLNFDGVLFMSHSGPTTYFPARVLRQIGGLQIVPEDTAQARFEHTWREDQPSADR